MISSGHWPSLSAYLNREKFLSVLFSLKIVNLFKMIDLEKVKQNWFARGYSFDIWTDPPGETWEDFTHLVDELFMVLEGNVEIEIQGKVQHPSPGEEIFIPAQALHSVRNRGETTARWLYGYKTHSKKVY